MAHRMFFKRGGSLVPVKGSIVTSNPGLEFSSEDNRVFARLFRYVIEGPPYTAVPTVLEVDIAGDAEAQLKLAEQQLARPQRLPTRFEVTAVNAIHAREDVIASSAFRPTHGSGFQVLWGQVEEGAPEHDFAQSLTSAHGKHDEMTESCVDYKDWEAKHGQFVAAGLSPDQRKALFEFYGGGSANVDMELRLRAARSEHWQSIAPEGGAFAEAAARGEEIEEAEESRQDALKSLAEKFQDVFDGMTEEEKEALSGFMGSADPVAAAAMAGFGQTVAGVAGQAFPGGPGMSQQLADFAKGFPGMAGAPLSVKDLIEAESASRGYAPGAFAQQAFPGMGGFGTFPPPIPPPFPGMPSDWVEAAPPQGLFGMPPFAPGPGESFTLEGQERDQRQLEASTAEADALRARLHSDNRENRRKIGMFKDVVVGGLRFLLEKIEGPAAPVPPEPMGPVEQGWASSGVNGGRDQVMSAIREQLGAVRPQLSPQAPEVGAPGETF
jgi:hypothetical protein